MAADDSIRSSAVFGDPELARRRRAFGDRLLAKAAAAGRLPEPGRRERIFYLTLYRFTPSEGQPTVPEVSADDFIEAAYPSTAGYPGTHYFWHSWLQGRISPIELADCLARMAATNVADWHQRWDRLEHALSRRPNAREDDEGALVAAWLASCLDVQELLPASLLDYLALRSAADRDCTLAATPAPALVPTETTVPTDAAASAAMQRIPVKQRRHRPGSADAAVKYDWRDSKLSLDCPRGELLAWLKNKPGHQIWLLSDTARARCIERVRQLLKTSSSV